MENFQASQNEGEYDWYQPTEDELKAIRARRERNDRVSQAMAKYLLQGYKMLATVCPECGTVLLQNKEGRDYCVACSEIDANVALASSFSANVTSEGSADGSANSKVMRKRPSDDRQATAKIGQTILEVLNEIPLNPEVKAAVKREEANVVDGSEDANLANLLGLLESRLFLTAKSFENELNPEKAKVLVDFMDSLAKAILSVKKLKMA